MFVLVRPVTDTSVVCRHAASNLTVRACPVAGGCVGGVTPATSTWGRPDPDVWVGGGGGVCRRGSPCDINMGATGLVCVGVPGTFGLHSLPSRVRQGDL